MDVSSVAGLVSGLQSSTQIVKAMLGMKIDSEVKAAIVELQNSLIGAQSAALGSLAERDQLYARVRELEKAMEGINRWEDQRKDFVAIEFATGHSVYRSENPDFPGLYCPKCIENGRASRMQEERASTGYHRAQCLQCETNLRLERRRAEMRISSPNPYA